MIKMADRGNKGFVDIEDFVSLMRELGLINDKDSLEDANNTANQGSLDLDHMKHVNYDDPVLREEMAARNANLQGKY